MLSSLGLLVPLSALGATATRDLWLPGLPGCWQSCIGSTEDGCRSSGCICTTSSFSASYLPSAVSCAVTQCRADEWALDVVLGSLELYCDAINWPIPEEVLEKAYAAASNQGLQSMSVAKPSTTKQAAPKTTKGSSDQAVTSTYRTTLTQTTLDSNGNTIQIIVPIVLGPTGYSTGSIITSTVHGRATSTTAPLSSAAASPRSTAPFSAAPTQESSSTSSARSSSTQRPANGNGSPFENMQAGASSSWSTSGLLQVLGIFAVLLMWLRY